MGRGKIEIKRIENQNNRKVTFAKRRDGLLKKAREISVLCDAKVSVVIFGPNSRLYSNKPPPETFSSILDVYHKQSTQRLWDEKHEDLDREIERVKKENENMNIELRHYKAEDVQSLSPRELASLENLLENGLTCIRNKKAELVEHLRNRRDIAEAENVHLQNKLAEMNVQGNNIGDEYNQRIVNANSNIMPFSFRVQPMQPNLHGMGFRN